jgi:hypothetical protein
VRRALIVSALLLVARTAQASGSTPVHPSSALEHVEPAAAYSSSGLIVAYVERGPSHAQVMAAFSADGTHFDPPISVSGPTGSTEAIRPHVSASGSRAVICWADASRSDHDIYLVVSNDGGRSFSTPTLVAGGPGGQLDPRSTVLPDGTIVVAYHDSFGSSADDGGVVWRIRATKSRDGSSFAPAVALGTPGAHYDLFAAVSGAGTSTSPLAVAWLREDFASGSAILVAQSIDGGSSFGPEARIDPPGVRHLRPRIAAEGPSMIVVFDSFLPADMQLPAGFLLPEPEYLDVHAVTSTSAGRLFSAPQIANATRAFQQERSDVSIHGSRVVTAWIDHSMPDVRRVIARQSLDGGKSFGPELTVSEVMPGVEVHHPAVAVGPAGAVVVFEDARGGGFDVRASLLP